MPTVCGTWALDSIEVPGFTVLNLEINHTAHTYCFELAKSEFPEDSCSELYAISYFSSNLTGFTSNASNSIVICDDEFESYIAFDTIGICQNNNTSTLISDDYYYLKIDLNVNYGDTWSMQRILDNLYPNESGSYVIKTGAGSGIINLGPLLIQEGSWELVIEFGDCSDTFEIEPPYYCSGCSVFRRAIINNISCEDPPPSGSDPTDDTWSFDLKIPGLSGTYTINSAGPYSINTTYPIDGGDIIDGCKTFILSSNSVMNCEATIIVCPPKPCSDECDLEFYVLDIGCDGDEYFFHLFVTGAGTNYPCFKTLDTDGSPSTGNPNDQTGSLSPGINYLEGFDDDIYLTVYLCNSSECDCDLECFKTIYIHYPDCENLEYRHATGHSEKRIFNEVEAVPNPINANQLLLKSSLKTTEFVIFDASGNKLTNGYVIGSEYKIAFNYSAGMYLLKFINSKGKFEFIKVIKL